MTKGEELLGRPLYKEMKAGVPHYKPGQHHAEIVGDDAYYTAMLGYVSAMGHAVQVLCRRCRNGHWEVCPKSVARSAGQTMLMLPQALPPGFSLSADSIAALEAAEKRYSDA